MRGLRSTLLASQQVGLHGIMRAQVKTKLSGVRRKVHHRSNSSSQSIGTLIPVSWACFHRQCEEGRTTPEHTVDAPQEKKPDLRGSKSFTTGSKDACITSFSKQP